MQGSSQLSIPATPGFVTTLVLLTGGLSHPQRPELTRPATNRPRFPRAPGQAVSSSNLAVVARDRGKRSSHSRSRLSWIPPQLPLTRVQAFQPLSFPDILLHDRSHPYTIIALLHNAPIEITASGLFHAHAETAAVTPTISDQSPPSESSHLQPDSQMS